MPKAYWITWYRSVSDHEAHARYAKAAGPVLQAFGGRFLVRGVSVAAPEGLANERAVVVVFDSVGQALAAYNSADYQATLADLCDAVEREVRIFEAWSPPAVDGVKQ